MSAAPQIAEQVSWTELATQQLVRYEALFTLLEEIQALDDLTTISRRVATQLKYFANVISWRMVIAKAKGFQVIDGFRGDAHVEDVKTLSPWDQRHWELQRPSLVRGSALKEPPLPPEHLAGKSVTEITVMPCFRKGHCIAVLSAAASGEGLSDLDSKFIRLFGRLFADRTYDTLLRIQAMEDLIVSATHDGLTGLLNHGTILDRLRTKLALCKLTGQPLSVILADVDLFKAINDTYGHLTGDYVLREISHRLQTQVREGDSLGRFGGEEFLFVLYPCSEEEVAEAAEKIRRAIADQAFRIESDPPAAVNVTISLGTANGRRDVTIESLIKRADEALYRSKTGGRNRVTAGDGYN